MYNNKQLAEDVNLLAQYLFHSVRIELLPKGKFSWQEVSIIVDCFIRMYDEFETFLLADDADIRLKVLDIYNKSYKDVIDLRVKTAQLYTIQCFQTVVDHLCSKGLLKWLVFYLFDEIEKKQKEWENARLDVLFVDFLNPPSTYSPVACIQEMLKCNYCTCQDWLSVRRNSDNVFFTYTIADKYGNLYFDCDNCRLFDFAACIWPFQDGYARILCRNGKWGYISVESNAMQLIDSNVLYADDFSCERARVQIDDLKFKYLGLCLEDCFQKTFTKAGTFHDGYALVSDECCSDYHIDVYGNITVEDKKRYELSKAKYKEDKKKFLEKMQSNRKASAVDWENTVMNSLSGHGCDPEFFGF